MKQTYSWVRRKNRNKYIRVIIQTAILLMIVFVLIKSIFFGPTYQSPVGTVSETTDTGFIALSYFGVDRGESNRSLISTRRLDEHLRALRDAGYVTVSQRDVLEYYHNGKALPEKALFLIFEDGREDTAFFVQPLLEQYNFRATALTYAEYLCGDDTKYLKTNDLENLCSNTFWELGTNGYRLAYINVFDRYGNFLDVLGTEKFQMMSPYLERRYDYYLMDFIRDEYGIPKETPEEMRQRISRDYESLQRIYTDELGDVPGAYIFMRPNTGYFGTNPKAGEVNAQWMTKLFDMNFNREGSCFNTMQSGAYDLTRTRPNSYWYTNHLLMRIRDDTGLNLEFITGDTERGRHWDVLTGAAEFIEERIVLTSLPRSSGTLRWNGGALEDLRITVTLDGNKAGGQSVYLRADNALEHYIAVRITDNVFRITEKTMETAENVLFEKDLNLFDGVYIQSLEENRRDAEAYRFEMEARYAVTPEQAGDAVAEMNRREDEPAQTVAEGADEYLPEINRSEAGHRKLDITLSGSELTVLVDGQPIAEGLPVEAGGIGDILLEASVSGTGHSEWKTSDDVYDGVFSNLVIYSIQEDHDGDTSIVYDNRVKGLERISAAIVRTWNATIDWFIKVL